MRSFDPVICQTRMWSTQWQFYGPLYWLSVSPQCGQRWLGGMSAVNLSSVATVTKQFCRLYDLLLLVPSLCPPPAHTHCVSATLLSSSPLTSLLVSIHSGTACSAGPTSNCGLTWSLTKEDGWATMLLQWNKLLLHTHTGLLQLQPNLYYTDRIFPNVVHGEKNPVCKTTYKRLSVEYSFLSRKTRLIILC